MCRSHIVAFSNSLEKMKKHFCFFTHDIKNTVNRTIVLSTEPIRAKETRKVTPRRFRVSIPCAGDTAGPPCLRWPFRPWRCGGPRPLANGRVPISCFSLFLCHRRSVKATATSRCQNKDRLALFPPWCYV
jgi:hypothetical protein